MAKITKENAIALLREAGIDAAGSLALGRIERRINRLDKVLSSANDIKTSEKMFDLAEFVLEALEAGERVSVYDPADDDEWFDRESSKGKKETRRPVEKVPRTASEGRVKKGSPKKLYDWDAIFNGKINLLKQGDDYTCQTAAFAMQARNHARKRGLKIQIKAGQGQVVIQSQGRK